jgi:TatD DNase family protein
MAEPPPSDLLGRAAAADVAWMMCPGVDLESSLQARRIAFAHPDRVLWSAGLHPHDAAAWPQQERRLETLAAEATAIGECGLDYYRDLSPREAQRTAFRAQLSWAAAMGKPIIVHCRDAFADVFADLEAAALGERAILHCWTGGPKWTRRFADLGATFSFAGPLTYPTGDTVRRAAAVAPRERTMVETDTPYLTPPPHRDRPNEPANVAKVGEALAGVWGLPAAEVAALTTRTADRVLRGRT